MRVMSLLAPSDFAALRQSVPDTWVVRQVSYRGALKDLAGGPAGVIVVNPAELATDALQAIVAASHEGGGRVVLYDTDNLLGARQLVDLVTSAHVEVVAPMRDGSLIGVTSAIAMPERSVPCQVLRRIAPQLLTLPQECAGPAVKLFTLSLLPVDSDEFYRAVGAHQTAIGRWLDDANLCTAHELITIGRVARAYHEAQYGVSRLEAVQRARFPSAVALRNALRALLNASYADLTRSLSATGVIDAINAAAIRRKS